MNNGYDDILKIILDNWGSQGSDYLCFNEQNIKKLIDDINDNFSEFIMFENYEFVKFNYINFILTLFKVCPHICAHYNPTDSLISLKFTEFEKMELEKLSNEAIIEVKEQIADLSYLVYSDNINCFQNKQKQLVKKI